jgi:hypothetical protein
VTPRRYLQAVLSDPTVLESHEMWEFLSRDSVTYCEVGSLVPAGFERG